MSSSIGTGPHGPANTQETSSPSPHNASTPAPVPRGNVGISPSEASPNSALSPSLTPELSGRPGFATHRRKSSNSGVVSSGGSVSRGRSATPTRSYRSSVSDMPTKFAVPANPVDIYDQLEKEQEAIVNKREISTLHERSRSRSQSTSSSSSVTRQPSVRSMYSGSETDDNTASRRESRPSFSGQDEHALLLSLRRENEQLKRKLADLSIKLTEKDSEIETLKLQNGLPQK